MLFNRNWEVKAEPSSLESLIAWLEKQPSDGSYSYIHADRCLVAQYGSAIGVEGFFDLDPDEIAEIGPGWKFVALGPDGLKNHEYRAFWTFGAALARARAVLSRGANTR